MNQNNICIIERKQQRNKINESILNINSWSLITLKTYLINELMAWNMCILDILEFNIFMIQL